MKQCAPGAATSMLGEDEKLVEPGDQSAMLQSPGEGENRDSDGLGVAGEQDHASGWLGEETLDRLGDPLAPEIDAVLAKLLREEIYDVAHIGSTRIFDAHALFTGDVSRGFMTSSR